MEGESEGDGAGGLVKPVMALCGMAESAAMGCSVTE